MHGQLSSFFVSSSNAHQVRLISLVNLFMDDRLRRPFDGVANCAVSLLPGPSIVNLDCVNDVVLLGNDPRVVQAAISRLAAENTKYGIHFCSIQVQCFPKIGREILLHSVSCTWDVALPLLHVSKGCLPVATLRPQWRRRNAESATPPLIQCYSTDAISGPRRLTVFNRQCLRSLAQV